MKNATWKMERAASMRYIARSYLNLHNEEEAEFWYKSAINEELNVREGYVELAMLYYNQGKWLDSICCLIKALRIKTKPMVYINEVFAWDGSIEDIMSLNYYYLGIYDLALYYVDKALEYKNNDKRLLSNRDIFINLV